MNFTVPPTPAPISIRPPAVVQVAQRPSSVDSFERNFLLGESDYFAVSHDPKTGLVYDGVNLKRETGQVEALRDWSAPSKECLDLAVLIKGLNGDPKAALVIAKGDVQLAQARSLELLEKKMDAYQQFHQDNPGYAGFLPWYSMKDGRIEPMSDWKGKIPGLDNGEWIWSMLAAEKALKDSGHGELASKYHDYNQMIEANVAKVFFDPDGVACRGDVTILPQADGSFNYEPLNKGSYMTGEHGVHEGSMLIHYLSLFGQEMPEGSVDKIWSDIEMKRVETPHGTTWQGFWGSAHESWAYLFLPCTDHKGYDDLFRIREKIRTQNAVERGYPGLATSTNGPNGGYFADCGIEGVGSQPIGHNETSAVYGAFPLLFQGAHHPEHAKVADAWLENMLKAPRMTGPLGCGESFTNDGTAFAPMKTTDGSQPIWLAMMGGITREIGDVLKERGLYDKFQQRIDSEFQEAFGGAPLREPSDFAAPKATVPHDILGDYLVAKSPK